MKNVGRVLLGRRGIALMMALFLVTLLFVLGVSLLYFLDQDSRFGLEMQRSQQAQALARSGILYARNEEYNNIPAGIPFPTNGGAGYVYWSDASQTLGFRIWKEADLKTIKSMGMVRDASGRVLASRTLAVWNTPSQTMQVRYWDYDL